MIFWKKDWRLRSVVSRFNWFSVFPFLGFKKGFGKMVKAKSGLVGSYEIVRLEYLDDTCRDRRMLIINGSMEQMCEFYEALKDAMENAVNADSKKFGYSDATGEHHFEYKDEELDDWRTEPNEIAAYEKAKKDGLREGLMRFAAEESRFSPPATGQ